MNLKTSKFRSLFNRRRVIGLSVVLTICAAVQAQDWSENKAMRALEAPGHEALMSLIARPTSTLAPFETDGCSGGLSGAWQVAARHFPDFAQAHQSSPPWENCCVSHDQAYHNAGGASDPRASFDARLNADRILKACVIETGTARVDTLVAAYDVDADQVASGYGAIADAMFVAVRIGGGPCSGLPWRWGYGYPSCSVFTGVLD